FPPPTQRHGIPSNGHVAYDEQWYDTVGTGQPVNDADDAWMTEDGDESDTETERGDEHGGLDVNMANSPPTEIGQTLPT
ncbi:hypothetical protein LTR16_012712, partial [Cryomyces antarcticus]